VARGAAPGAAPTDRVIALLRGVNVGGHGKLPMAELRATLTRLGYGAVRTRLHSGNVVFEPPAGGAKGRTASRIASRTASRAAGRAPAGRAADAALEQSLEATIASEWDLTTEVLVRRPDAWGALMARNPFVEEAERDPARLMVLGLKGEPVTGAEAALLAAIRGPERARVIGRECYIVYPDGMGNSRLTLPVIERALGTRGTARNWNTVRKLAELVAS